MRSLVARDPELEIAIMEILWASEVPLTPTDVRTRLGHELAYSTVMTVMVRLWKKGLLHRQRERRSYRYGSVFDRDEVVARNMLDFLIRSGGSESVLARFVDGLGPGQLNELKSALEES